MLESEDKGMSATGKRFRILPAEAKIIRNGLRGQIAVSFCATCCFLPMATLVKTRQGGGTQPRPVPRHQAKPAPNP